MIITNNPFLFIFQYIFDNLHLDLWQIVLIFVIIFAIPLIFPLYELWRKKEGKLNVDLLYSRSPDYWGKSYLNLLLCTLSNNYLNNIRSFDDIKKIETDVLLELNFCFDKGKDKFFITKNFVENIEKIADTKKINFIVLNTDSLVLDKSFVFNKEVVVLGDLVLNSECIFHSLIVLGDLYINSKTRVLKFLHVEGKVFINNEINIGNIFYASDSISIFASVAYKRIFSPRIISKEDIDEYKYTNVEENKKIEISGNMKIEGKFNIDSKEKYVIIDGNLVCNSDLKLAGNVWAKNNVFSQENIFLSDGVIVGVSNKIKSVVARKKVVINGKVKIYGYVHSEQEAIITP